MAQPAPRYQPAPDKAFTVLAVHLLKTRPKTTEHANKWAAYRYATVLRADLDSQAEGHRTTAQQLNVLYISRLAICAGSIDNMHVIIPPLDWELERWERDFDRIHSAIQVPEGVQLDRLPEHAILEGFATGDLQVNDRRVWDARFLARTAFRVAGVA